MKKEISILNHNMFFKPMGFQSTSNEYKKERGLQYPSLVKDFDILMIQEAFRAWNPRYEAFLEGLIENGFEFMAIGTPPDFGQQSMSDSGLLIASKFPIIYSQFTPSNYGTGLEGLINKGILYAQIKMPNNKCIHAFNFHTQAYYLHHSMEKRIVTHRI